MAIEISHTSSQKIAGFGRGPVFEVNDTSTGDTLAYLSKTGDRVDIYFPKVLSLEAVLQIAEECRNRYPASFAVDNKYRI